MDRSGLTILELLAVTAIIAVILGLVIPKLQSAREATRLTFCSNQLRFAAIAVHNYHDAFENLPTQLTGTRGPGPAGGYRPPGHNQYRLSGWVGLLPFMEAQSSWETISLGDAKWSPMGPPPWVREFDPWQTDFYNLRCPSDAGFGLPAHGRTNYVFCLGDATHRLDTGPVRFDRVSGRWTNDLVRQCAASGRGVFVPRMTRTFASIQDGLAQTAMLGECITDCGDGDIRTCGPMTVSWDVINNQPTWVEKNEWRDSNWVRYWAADGPVSAGLRTRPNDQRRGYRWADGAALYTGFNTILPPNREIFLAGGDAGIGMLPPSSQHPGGVHVAMADASVRFVSDSIDAGDLTRPTVQWHPGEDLPAEPVASPYGVWGAMGTRASEEIPPESRP